MVLPRLEMEFSELRAVIKYLRIKGLPRKAVHEELVTTLGEDAPSYSMVKKWYAEFAHGRTSTEDAARSGRPADVTTPEMVDKVLSLILSDRRLTIRHVSTVLNISNATAHSIITEHIGMHKVSARWVPRNLSPEQKQARVNTCQENLTRLRRNPQDFLARIITVDET